MKWIGKIASALVGEWEAPAAIAFLPKRSQLLRVRLYCFNMYYIHHTVNDKVTQGYTYEN